MAARRSKIARLPWEVRRTVCAMIADGRPAREVCAFVNAGDALSSQGLAPLTEQNVSEWRAGGQREWEANQASAERLARLNEASLHLVEASGGDPSAVGSRILAGRISTMLEGLGAEESIPLAKALATLRQAETAAARIELERGKAEMQRESIELGREQLSLSRAKFERDTARLFVKWAQSKEALALATDSRMGADEKTERLGRLMFGDLWESADDGK